MPRMITIEKVTWTIDIAMHSVVWYSLVVVAFLQETYVVGSTQWPSEQYALLKPETGCPSNWKDKAWIFQDTKLKTTSNERSRILHIDGHVSRYYVVRSFCIKTGMDAGSLNWPQEPPITVSSNSNVLFVFRSDESNNSTGFKADYSVFPQLKAKPTATHSGPAATLPSETSSMPLTTPRSESNEETIIKTSTASKKEDTQATTQTSNSKSTVRIKTKAVTTNQQQLTTVHESSTPSNCTSDDRGKEALTNSRQWNGKLIVIVIPLACFLVIVFLIVDIVYRYRSKRKNLRKTASEIRSVDQLPMAVNPTYDSGAILLNQPNDTTIPTTIMRINENDLNTNQPLTDRPPDYEDVENWKPSKTAPKKDHTIPGCNGSNACSETTTEETTKISENPFYESAMTSPPFVEANKLYESVKMDQGKTEK